jgi:hypothetical protein
MNAVDRKNRKIEEGDIVAFDVPVFYGTEEHKTKMWDIFWGKAVQDGVMVDFCPITQKNNVVYKFPEEPSELLIIRKHVDGGLPNQMSDGADAPPVEIDPEVVMRRKEGEE